jgi:nitroimidazol reductase NimA-like FMN-containing flavoprotein (pyridoxamine 5'-phosphate oxidase superfamily)
MPLESGTGIRELTVDECWQRLADHPSMVGRIGIGGPSPDILPVNYALDGHSLVFRTAPGKKLSAVDAQERVVFEVDDVDPGWSRGWSVVLRGFAEHVTDPAALARLEQLPLQPWDPDPKTAYIRITTHLVSGREIS